MLITNLTIDAGKIHFDNISLDFSLPGIYLIIGDNGCGKTTLIRSILSNREHVHFKDEVLDDMFLKNPGAVISYIPQTLNRYSCSIEQYIKKGCTNLDISLEQKMLSMLELSHIDENQNIVNISDGELTKLSIVAAFLKETPYIILDEPTNHLDNRSVKQLIKLIESEKDEKTIIIVSHDERILDRYSRQTIVNNGHVEQRINENDVSYVQHNRFPSSVVFHPWKRATAVFFARYNLACIILIMIAFGFLLSYNMTLYGDNYSYDNGTYSSNIIHTYKAEYIYTDTNRFYTTAEKIDIPKSKYNRYIEIGDIYNILSNLDITNVIVFDSKQFYDDIQHEKVLSVPRFFIEEYRSMYTGTSLGVGSLIHGEYPSDYKNEICVPQDKVDSIHNMDTNSLKDNIGKEVFYKGKSYVLSGIHNGQNVLVSYSGDDVSGFKNLNVACLDEMLTSYGRHTPAPGLFILTRDGCERKILNHLIKKYPAENYISKVFSRVWEQFYNRTFIIKRILPINLIISLLFCVLIGILRRYQAKANQAIIRDYNAYFLKEGFFRRCINICSVLESVLILLLILLANHLLNNLAFYIDQILLMDYALINVPIVYGFRRKREQDAY